MTEADVQADYTRKVVAARVGLAKALETRILNLKAERDRALALIREGDELNEIATEGQQREISEAQEPDKEPDQEPDQEPTQE